MTKIINLGNQHFNYKGSEKIANYSFIKSKNLFVLEQVDSINGEIQLESMFQIQLDVNKFIQSVLTKNNAKQVTSEDLNLESHYSYLYGEQIYETETHKSTWSKEEYETLSVFIYDLVPMVRILKTKEVFYSSKPCRLTITNEFQNFDDLNLDFYLENIIRDEISKRK